MWETALKAFPRRRTKNGNLKTAKCFVTAVKSELLVNKMQNSNSTGRIFGNKNG